MTILSDIPSGENPFKYCDCSRLTHSEQLSIVEALFTTYYKAVKKEMPKSAQRVCKPFKSFKKRQAYSIILQKQKDAIQARPKPLDRPESCAQAKGRRMRKIQRLQLSAAHEVIAYKEPLLFEVYAKLHEALCTRGFAKEDRTSCLEKSCITSL